MGGEQVQVWTLAIDARSGTVQPVIRGPAGRRELGPRRSVRPAVPVTHIGLIQNWVEELKAKVPTGR